jgi:hypothetical protein
MLERQPPRSLTVLAHPHARKSPHHQKTCDPDDNPRLRSSPSHAKQTPRHDAGALILRASTVATVQERV